MKQHGRLDFEWDLCHLCFSIPGGEHSAVFLLKNLTVWKRTVSWMLINVHILQRKSAHAYSTSLGRTFSACVSVEVFPRSLPLELEISLATEEDTHTRFGSITTACNQHTKKTCSGIGGEEFPHFHNRTQGSFNPHSQNHFYQAEIVLYSQCYSLGKAFTLRYLFF